MAEQISTKAMYSIDFQRQVVLLYCGNVSFAQNYGNLIKSEYFETQQLRSIFRIVEGYVTYYERELLRENLVLLVDEFVLSKGYAAEVARLLRDEVKDIFNSKISSEDFIIDSVVTYCRRQEFSIALGKCIDLLDNNGNYEEAVNLVHSAVAVGSGVDLGLSWDDMAGFSKRYRERYNPEKLIATGIPALDDALMGGMAPGEVHTVIGPPKCLRKNSQITLLDGSTPTIKELAESDKKEFWVWAATARGDVIPALAKSVRITGHASRFVRVHLDNDEFIDTTIDHKYMLRDGSWIEAKDLKPDNSLMPLYTKINETSSLNGYLKVRNNRSMGYQFVVRIEFIEVAEEEPVYCMEVPGYNNFALAAGVFVHNCGKSTFACNIGANIMLRGKKVFHVSLEIDKIDVMAKYAVRLTSVGYNELRTIQDFDFESRIKRFDKYSPRLFISSWPERTVSTLAIRSWISNIRAKYEIQPDVIILDYDDCTFGDTKISMLDGTERRIDSLIGEEEFWVYSCKEDGTVVPGRGHSARKVRDVSEIMEITLDNGETVRFTTNHRFMLRDGSYKRAENLQPGDSLMPLYRKESDSNRAKGYTMYKDNVDGQFKYVHRSVAEHIFSQEKEKVESRLQVEGDFLVVHHKNENPLDNRPENLVWLTNLEHLEHHSPFIGEGSKWADPEWCEYKSSATKDQWTDEFRAKRSDEVKEQWKNTNIGDVVSGAFTRDWADPDSKFNAHKKEPCPHCGTMLDMPFNKWRSHLQHCKQNPKKLQQLKDREEIRPRNCHKCGENVETHFYGLNGHIRNCGGKNNHKVVSVKLVKLDTPEPVYDITVDEHHNFALSAGVFVHNCLLPTSGGGKGKDDMYGNAGEIYTDLIKLASYWQVPILTFAQPRREAWDKFQNTGELITASDLAHSALKAHKTYSISSLNFKDDDEVGIFYVDMVRRGTSNVRIRMQRDLKRGVFKEFTESNGDQRV